MNKEQYYKLSISVITLLIAVFLFSNFIVWKINWLLSLFALCFGIVILLIVEFYLRVQQKISVCFNRETRRRGYYSAEGQDRWIVEDIFDYKKNCFFVELGAADGIHDSNTFILEKDYGWNGVCIEAESSIFKKLKSNRNCICVNACVDGCQKKVKFTDGKYLTGGIIDRDTNNKNLINCNNFEYKNTVTLADIFTEYSVPGVIDYFEFRRGGGRISDFKGFSF